MPILKPISGHGSVAGIRRYLEKKNRAIGRDVLNLPLDGEWVCEDRGQSTIFVDWDVEMDATREAYGTNSEWRGLKARTFKHFVISPDPEDRIDLASLRELAQAWVGAYFPDHEVAIVYHEDNEGRIPHAHVVVNNVNLKTGYRMQTEHPEDLNRALQDMARERGLAGLSNVMPERSQKSAEAKTARTRQSIYFGRAEKEIMHSGNYSWVGDIRARVALAKNTSRSEADFMEALRRLGIDVADNSSKARRDDWIFSLADEPTKKVSGERLGFTFGKQMLRSRFERQSAYHPERRTEGEIRRRAVSAVELNDLQDLSRLSAVLETCAKFDIRYLEDFDARAATLARRDQLGSEGFRRLAEARVYVAEHNLMAHRSRSESAPASTRRRGNQHQSARRTQEAEQRRDRERSDR